jgi:DNA-binding IclR family transcriptional regulator
VTATDARGAVKSAERALSILELLTREERPMAFAELVEALGYPRSSLHGLLRTMTERGWLELDPVTRRYGLGIRTWEAGSVYLRAVQLAERGRPYLEKVRADLDETVQLSVLDGLDNVYIAKVDGSQRLILASEVGRRLKAYATGLGKVLLAGLPRDQVAALLEGVTIERHTANTITDRDALLAELDEVRERGYAIDREEYTIGVRCVAVPVHDYTGGVVAAMSVSVPTVRFDPNRQARALELLRAAAQDFSGALGHRDVSG